MGLIARKPDLHANNKATDQPVPLSSLINSFVIGLLESIISNIALYKI